MSLYEISTRYKSALVAVENEEFTEEEMKDTLDSIEGEFKDKAISIAMAAQNMMVTANAKKELAKKLNEDSKKLEYQNERLMNYLDLHMSHNKIEGFDCDYFKIKYRKLPDLVEVLDEDFLPESYKKQKTITTVDKTSLKKDLASKDVKGAKLVKNRRKLEIK